MSTVFFDIDTQLDFVLPAGALYVPGAEKILPAVAALNQYARANSIPVIATADAHLENDPEFAAWPPHCVAGTHGAKKPEATTFPGQIVLNKRSVDCFSVAELPALLKKLGARQAVVYGVVTEICVRHAIFGLLDRGYEVTLVTDAIRSLDEPAAARTVAEFTARAGKLSTSAALCSH